MQLRMLLFMAVAVAALVLPGAAFAASDVQAYGAYTAGPPTDADNEVAGIVYDEGDDIPFRVELINQGADPTEALQFEVSFFDFYVDAVTPADVTVVSGTSVPTCTVDNDGIRAFSCTFAPQLAPAAQVTLQINVTTVENSYEFNDLETTFSVLDDAGSFDLLEETTDIRDLEDPTCENQGYFYGSSFTRAELQNDGTLSIPIACSDPDGGALTITPKAGTYGTLTGSGTNATFTATPATLASPNGFFEYFEVVLTDDEGDTTNASILVAAYTQSNVSSTISGQTAYAVPAAGGTVTYTNTVRNAGPDALGRVGFGWETSDKATIVSATAGGAAATCEPAGYGDEGLRAFGCGSAAMPAVGATVTGTITVRYAAGEKGLTLPSTVKVTAIAGPDSTTGAEDRSDGDNESAMNTALSAFVAPANPTQGTDGNDTYKGTSGSDTYAGGAGNDTFRGEAGDDKFYGGAGDDVFDGGSGSDKFYGGTGDDAGFGGLGDDLMFGGLGNERLVGGDGTDKLYGQAGNDRLLGSTGNDVVNGGPGNDLVRGGTGNDVLLCGSGTDIATGDNGNDLISCRDGKGGDILSGGNGRDTCIGDVGDRFWSCERIIRLA
jgi:Ca2+-binding RTX toxin-like protein